MSKKILVVVSHPDDEVLGCFGTIAKYIKEGYEAYTLILGEGKTSRYDSLEDADIRENEKLNEETYCANDSIGVKKVFMANFPDNRFDNVNLLDIVKYIEKVKEQIQPEIIFTHYKDDLNIDHRITYDAVLTATRPMENECVKEIYSFEVLSSTEWNYPLSFSPDFFVDISETIDMKKQAMRCYESELREFPHPRSIEGIDLSAKHNGMRVGKAYVEAFKTVRVIK